MPRRKSEKPTKRELEILAVLWRQGPRTVRQVHEELEAHGRRGYTGTLKLMQIMAEKGLVKRDESQRSHTYRAALEQAAAQRGVVRELLDLVFAGSTEQLVLGALEAQEVSPDELKRIRRMLDTLQGGLS